MLTGIVDPSAPYGTRETISPDERARAQSAHGSAEPTIVAPKSVLVADDEFDIVDLLATLLEDEGFKVLRAYDGEQAWGLVLRFAPDLVISDIGMPRLDGLDLLRRLRAAAPLRETPVILMSAAVRRLESERAAFIPKPFDLNRLLSVVESQLLRTG